MREWLARLWDWLRRDRLDAELAGLYGVITYNVAQRMHELGVRIALGAQSRDVVRLVVGQGLRFAVAGVVIGLATALAVARWIQPLLFQQYARGPRHLRGRRDAATRRGVGGHPDAATHFREPPRTPY